MFYDYISGNRCLCGFYFLVIFEDHDNWKELLNTNIVEHSLRFGDDCAVNMMQVGEWCDENLKEGWAVQTSRAGFYNEEDAAAFKLRWL